MNEWDRYRELLLTVFGREEALRWIQRPNAALNGYTPCDITHAGRIDEVIALLTAMAEGVPQ